MYTRDKYRTVTKPLRKMNSQTHTSKIARDKEEESLMAETLLKIRRSNSMNTTDSPNQMLRLAPRPRFLSHDAAAATATASQPTVPSIPIISQISSSTGYFSHSGIHLNNHPSVQASSNMMTDAGVFHLLNPTSTRTDISASHPTLTNTAAFSVANHPSVLVQGISSVALQSSNLERKEKANMTQEELIRKEEVEKALLSKPQRGRRRDNLSNSERLELARTRNREHAKSTRIRKKARVQELEEMEKKHQLLVAQQEINQKRRERVVDFLKLRESMIRDQMYSISCVENHEQSQVVDEVREKLEDLVEDVATFLFRNGAAQDEESDALTCMKNIDEQIVSLVRNKFGQQSSQPISYALKDTMDDIALSLQDVAMVEVHLVLNSTVDIKLISAFLRVKFVPESVKMRSVVFSVFENALQGGDFDNLNGQVSHPSVVSLDADRERVRDVLTEGADEMDETAGPGMNI